MWLDTGGLPRQQESLAYISHSSVSTVGRCEPIVPAPYDGKYVFPSTVELDPVTGRPAGAGSPRGRQVPGGHHSDLRGQSGRRHSDAACRTSTCSRRSCRPASKMSGRGQEHSVGDISSRPSPSSGGPGATSSSLPDQAAINAYYTANIRSFDHPSRRADHAKISRPTTRCGPAS